MVNIKVNDSLRKKRRELHDALGDDVLRYITELITNSDDSYRRMENDNLIEKESEKIIYLEVLQNKDNYIISITDNAEGMTKKEIKNIFGTYGGDNSRGNKLHTRGIFGQGASDVLRASACDNKIARIETIKNNKITILNYKMDEYLNPSIEVEEKKLAPNKLKKYREDLRIPFNGTKITFGIPKRVKFTKKIKESLPTLIAKYSSFRYMLNQSNRKLVYIEPFMETVINSNNYQFLEENKISETEFKFKFEDKRINCNLKLYNNSNKFDDNTNIIVRDENYNVFDNTMFAFANSNLAQNISGELIIYDFYNLCYEHLNREEPDAIIRDNRTGFDTKNIFYEILSKNINPIIESELEKNVPNIKTTDLTNNKKFNEALKKLNKYLQSEIKNEINGGNLEGNNKKQIDGIKFARCSATLTKGKSYNIKLYINSDLVLANEEIKINLPSNDCIVVEPLSLSYQESEIKDSIVVKNISIDAINLTFEPILIEAIVSDMKTSLEVEVIDDEVYYPKGGMEFYPKNVSQVYNKPHNLKLFIDTDYVPIDSKIEIFCDGLSVLDNVIVSKRHLVNDKIGIIGVSVLGGEIGKIYEVKASFNDIVAYASITLIEPNNNEKLGGGLISKITLEASDKPYQSTYNQYTHVITINTKNPINMKIMGDMRDKNPNNPTFNKEQTKYLCDIIASQASSLVVKRNIQNGELNFNSTIESYEEIENLIQDHKNKIYEEMYPILLSIAE